MLKRASEWAKTQGEAADSMTRAWSRSVPRWRKMLLEYKKDNSKPNPFEEPDLGKSVHICTRSLGLNSLYRRCSGQVEEPTRTGRLRAAEGWGYLSSRDVAC